MVDSGIVYRFQLKESSYSFVVVGREPAVDRVIEDLKVQQLCDALSGFWLRDSFGFRPSAFEFQAHTLFVVKVAEGPKKRDGRSLRHAYLTAPRLGHGFSERQTEHNP